MKGKSNTRYLLLVLVVFMTACSPLVVIMQPTSSAPLPGAQPTQKTVIPDTAVAPTIQIQAPTQAVPTATTVPPTATQTSVPQPTAISAPETLGCQDSAQYISDDGIDGTSYAPNTAFTKTWTVKNTGTCIWDDEYLVSQISGPYMTQSPAYLLVPQGTVVPGQTMNISVGMTSPVEDGNYRSDWGLKKKDGPFLPIQGGAYGNSFYVKINVNNSGSDAGKITAASIAIEQEQGSGSLCTANSTYFVHASITADGQTSASYELMSSAGQILAGNFQDLSDNALYPSVSGRVVFNQAGTKTIDLRFVGPYPHPDDITVILRVNGGDFYNSKLSCR